ncbi:MAG: hypothetical protein IH609_02765 [Dehalococcoidia bacterium]|nr:hypothetical protein [Dehalococcoidia bacterium]
MAVRKTARREVRLDPEDDRLLEDELRARKMTFAAWVRDQLAAAREARDRRRREQALERLLAARLKIDWDTADPDPATTLLNEIAADQARRLDPNA